VTERSEAISAVRRYGSGGPWEDAVGYSRVVAAGPWLLTAGCTATVDGVVVHVGDAGAQAREAFTIALTALAGAGATVDDVVRTRMYIRDRADATAVGAAHAEFFGHVRPTTGMYVIAGFMHPDHLVEVEVEAYKP
jgi:enamine deaminase RidA (YjgF/YER057c/UK114 family)